MNPNDLLQQGINAVRNGNKKEGAQKLAQVVQQESRNAEAWFWLAAATDDPNEAAACLRRVLKIDPNHTRAQQALGALEQGGIAQVNTPAPNEPSGGNMRPLNTGELLSGNMAFDTPYGSYSPPPISRPEQPTRTMPAVNPNTPAPFSENMTPAPNISGNDPTPPPPFGMPAWANQAPSSPNPRDAQTGRVNMPDPYAANQAGAPGMPPPPFQKGGTGLSFSQLDPAAAQAQQAAQAAPPPSLDPNADLRSKLLGNNQSTQATPPPPPFQGGGNKATFVPDPNLKQQPVKKGNNRRTPLLILVAAIVIFGVAAVALLILKPGSTTSIATPTDSGTPAATDTASLTPSPSAGTTTAANVTTTVAPGTTTGVATTTASGTTTAANTVAPTATLPGNRTTTAGATTAANTTAATTAAATATQTGPRTIPPLTTTVPTRTTTAAPATTTAAPAPTIAPATTTAAPSTSPYPLPAFGPEVPLPVVSYVTNANDTINGLSFIDNNINRLMFQPFNKAGQKMTPALIKAFIGNPELDYYLVELGQLARKLKDTRVADETPWLGTYSNDYANHLTDMLGYIDSFKSTGQEYFLKIANSYYDKATSDRTNWGKALGSGYPFKIPTV